MQSNQSTEAGTKYSTLFDRLKTFQNWPWPTSGLKLAKAGFYYIGPNDKTVCFDCKGGLSHWKPNDDPWTEHARWFPECDYVSRIKGHAFIKKCLNERSITWQQQMETI